MLLVRVPGSCREYFQNPPCRFFLWNEKTAKMLSQCAAFLTNLFTAKTSRINQKTGYHRRYRKTKLHFDCLEDRNLLNAVPTIAWNPVANATHYDFWVNDVTTGQS